MQRLKIDLPALFVVLSGLVAILSVPIKTLSQDFYKWMPFNPYRLAHVTAIVVGLSLIYLASQLRRKKFSAFLLTTGLLCFLILVEVGSPGHVHLALIYALSLGYLVSKRPQYVVRSDLTSLRRNATVSVILLLTIVLFAFVTFERIDQKEFGRELQTRQTLRITMDAMAGKQLPAYVHPTNRDRTLLFSLQAASAISLIIIFVGLFYPIRMRGGSSRWARHHAETLLQRYSDSSEDYLKLWPRDKHYYFYKDSFLAYGVYRGSAIVLDGASGNSQDFDGLRTSFVRECHINGWQLAIIHAAQREKNAWTTLGFSALYLGGEARVNIADFCETKTNDKHFRYVKNKAAKEGLQVIELLPSDATLKQLSSISNEWLATGRREYRFIMGYFDANYLQACRIFGLFKDGDLVAYTNLLPEYQDTHASIDHMRYTSDVPSVGMHYLLMSVALALRDTSFTTLNLGLAPLSKLEDNTAKVSKNILSVVRNIGKRYYSFAGIEQFKSKFGPTWEPTYLLYNGLPSRLAVIGSAVSSLTTYQPRRLSSKLLIAAAVAMGVCYASFPLAIFLNPPYAWSGMASSLGQAGRPNAWVFNSLDIISGCIGIGLSLYILLSFRSLPKLLKLATFSLLLCSVGAFMAAILRLPPGMDIDEHVTLALLKNPDIVLHLLSSVINSGGYLVALFLWARWAYRKFGFDWRTTLMVVILLLNTVGFVIGQLDTTAGSLIQRLFIVLFAVWLVVFVRDIIKCSQTTEPQ